MNRTFLTVLSAVAAVLVLTACRITITPTPPTTDVQVTANDDPTTHVATIHLALGETKWVRVSVPSSLRGSGQRLVVETDDDNGSAQLDVVLYSGDGVTPIASTSGTAYFRPGLSGLGEGYVGPAALAADEEVDRSVSVVAHCLGPCISRRADTSTVYVRLSERGYSSESVRFYAYAEPWIDEGEPANDSLAGAVLVLPGGGFYRGAIERLGDVDYVRFSQDGFITFSERTSYDTNLVMTVYTPGGTAVDELRPGDTAEVFANEYARIRSDPSQPRASVYGFYTVFY